MKRLIAITLLALGLALAPAAGLAQEPAAGLRGEPGAKKKVLLITESKGFVHSVVSRKVTVDPKAAAEKFPKTPGLSVSVDAKSKKTKVAFGGRLDGPLEIKAGDDVLAKIAPCEVEATFMKMSKDSGLFDVVCSQDARGEITGDNLKNFDAVFFYTTGELPLSDGQKADLLGFVRSGKGFGGSHCAADTFYKWKEYGDLIGAYFAGHPPGFQKIRVIVEDTKHPATKHLGESFPIEDEIYQFKEPYGKDKVHVLLRMDMASHKNVWRKDGDNPIAWVHDYGKGRVFYTALGHREEVWRDPRFQQHVIGGLRYIFRIEDGK